MPDRGQLDLSCQFWGNIFRQEFSPQLQGIADALEKRLLPSFAGIMEEAESVSQKTWDTAMSSLANGDEDPSDFAETTEQAGVNHYMLLKGLWQGMINLFTVALYQAFEQQIMMFLRNQVLHPDERNKPDLFKRSVLQKRMKVAGIDIESLPSWKKVHELKLLANTVKHAEGYSSKELHLLRPDFFEYPQVSFGLDHNSAPHVFLPLAGEDIYVSVIDVHQYLDSLLNFWEELLEAMKSA